MGACFNINLLTREPAAYVHARTYARRLLYDTIDYLDDGTINLSTGDTAIAFDNVMYVRGALATSPETTESYKYLTRYSRSTGAWTRFRARNPEPHTDRVPFLPASQEAGLFFPYRVESSNGTGRLEIRRGRVGRKGRGGEERPSPRETVHPLPSLVDREALYCPWCGKPLGERTGGADPGGKSPEGIKQPEYKGLTKARLIDKFIFVANGGGRRSMFDNVIQQGGTKKWHKER